MAVVTQNTHGWVLDTCALIDEGYSHCIRLNDGRKTKKRKRKHSELNQGEIDAQVFHDKIRSVILEGTKSLVDSARLLGHLSGASDTATDASSPPGVQPRRSL
ncbi:hypothetical protein INR49_011988 [Caranx melampygus]|nr:hypothetical protein INR49_011988 [Caranx melampygus]